MTAKTDHLGTGAFLKSEGPGKISRDPIVIASGTGIVLAGTVLGKVTASGEYALYNDDGGASDDGTRTAAAVLYADVDATSAAVSAVGITRLAEVWKDRLVWGAGVTTNTEKTNGLADLAAKFVIAR